MINKLLMINRFLIINFTVVLLSLTIVDANSGINSKRIDDLSEFIFSVTQHEQQNKSPYYSSEVIRILLADNNRYTGSINSRVSYIDAINMAYDGKHHKAQRLKHRLNDPVAKKIIDWLYVRSNSLQAQPELMIKFIEQNPSWPSITTIRKRIEASFSKFTINPNLVIGHLRKYPPLTVHGNMALASSYIKLGNKDKASKIIRNIWQSSSLNKEDEKLFLSKFSKLLTISDHKSRLIWAIYHQKSSQALRVAKKISSSHYQMAKAAVAMLSVKRNSYQLYSSLPESLKSQLVLQYVLARYYRKKKEFDKAANILMKIPTNSLSYPAPWWVEKKLVSRHFLSPERKKDWDKAYKMVSKHGFSSGRHFVDGEFMAGWIATSFLKNYDLAKKHLEIMRNNVRYARDIARAEYWLGRVYEAIGNKDKARNYYEAAAKHYRVYYGQLARDRIGVGHKPIQIPPASGSTRSTKAQISNMELVRAINILAKVKNKSDLSSFFSLLSYQLKSKGAMSALADLAWQLDHPHIALRVAKVAYNRNINIGRYAYPINAAPNYRKITDYVDKSLIYGLIRQESEFNTLANSYAGARGIMQIMPGTARMIAKKHRQPYRKRSLTANPSYNMTLGVAHLHDLLKDFNGSYIMTIAAYNAGKGRIPQWIRQFGDPRLGEIDPIDWIEAIPFTETRNYVKKVMENVHIYSSILYSDKTVSLTRMLQNGRLN